MRTSKDIFAQKIPDNHVNRIGPVLTIVQNRIYNGVRVEVRSQLNKEMIREYKALIELHRNSRKLECVVDRDELAMLIGLIEKPTVTRDVTIPCYSITAKMKLRKAPDNKMMLIMEDGRGTLRAVVDPKDMTDALKDEG